MCKREAWPFEFGTEAPYNKRSLAFGNKLNTRTRVSSPLRLTSLSGDVMSEYVNQSKRRPHATLDAEDLMVSSFCAEINKYTSPQTNSQVWNSHPFQVESQEGLTQKLPWPWLRRSECAQSHPWFGNSSPANHQNHEVVTFQKSPSDMAHTCSPTSECGSPLKAQAYTRYLHQYSPNSLPYRSYVEVPIALRVRIPIPPPFEEQ